MVLQFPIYKQHVLDVLTVNTSIYPSKTAALQNVLKHINTSTKMKRF